VIAVDLIGFGMSGRKSTQPYFDIDLWLGQAAHMLGLFQHPKVNVVGHSLSGALALKLAATDERIGKVITTGTMGTAMDCNPATELVWTFPETIEDLRAAGHTLVYDHNLIDETYIEGRKKVLYDGAYKTYFSSMFAGDKQAYVKAATLSSTEVSAIDNPVLLIHGRDDAPIPSDTSIELASRLQNADLVLLAQCSHSVALEHPQKLINLISMFMQ